MNLDHWMLEGSHFYRCPNSGRVLLASPTDDKVLCGCGSPAPKAVEFYKDRGPGWQAEPPGVHCKVFIERATAADYVRQDYEDDLCRQAEKAEEN